METLECITTRRSIRAFKDQPVEFYKIGLLLEAAGSAPSSGNVQNWRFILITSKDTMARISEMAAGQECIANAAILLIACSDDEDVERHYGLRGKRLYTVQNVSAATQNLLLAAHDLGLGAVWVGAFDEEKLSPMLSVPPSARIHAIICIGYPAEEPVEKYVRPLEITTYFRSFGSRIDNLHIVMRDYSVEWQIQAQKLKDVAVKGWGKGKGFLKKAHEMVKKKWKERKNIPK